MMAGGGREYGWTWQALAGLLCIPLLTGCLQRPSAPETRAIYFVEKLIREPQSIEDLRAVAEFPGDRGPEAYLDVLPVRTALKFLRGRARLGAELVFHASAGNDADPENRRVTVSVNEGLAIGTTPAVRFEVELARRGDEWKVTRLTAP